MTLPARAQEPGTTHTVHPGADGSGAVRRTVLPGGLRVITEAMPTVRSAAFGIWAGTGSRDEAPADAGASHYLEHVLFKGTERRTALEISAAVDAVGGDLNAFTAKEYTCYYARVLDADLPLAVDVVSDMVAASVNREEDVEAERGVILEEIAMRDDDPGDLIHDEFSTALYGDVPIGRPILGTVDSINALSRDRVHGYYRSHYLPPNLVVAAAGNVDHDEVVRLTAAAFAPHLAGDARPADPRVGGPEQGASPTAQVIDKDTEQAHIVLGGLGVRRTDERRFALGVLNAALGGGMSSRLFQEVREKRGLAYSVYSYTSQYADTGTFGVYAGCQPGKADEVLRICRDEIAKAAERGLTAEELERGKGQLRGGMVLGLEDTGSRMSRIAKSELVYESLLPVDEVLARIEAVTLDDVLAVAQDVLTRPQALTVIGPFGDHEFAL
ncbi:M16 family metallopeptidase [Actinomadura parmotrematis]|uniref:Insulinase family protein n=1 Tax=Actinomadura parmotrematis TaxID=2864039 RepID=A0ABS7FTB5_9ACTN|nr:pitrilysin family protein [Actinomadura parmotrematis]MBW8483651.1 insulinase family protein [Actinomadura parmotrematis]